MLVEQSENLLEIQKRGITTPNTDISLFAIAIPSEDVSIQDIKDVEDTLQATLPGQADVRRPLDGMRQREDNYATLSVILSGSARKLISNSSADGGKSKYTANLLVQNVNVASTEKMQLTQTFDKDRLLFFGSNLENIQVQAIVIENESFQWLKEFYENYNNYFRGTSLADENSSVEFRFEEKTVIGYLTQFNFSRTSTDLHQANISFTLVATSTVFDRPLKTTARVLEISSEKEVNILSSITTQLANSSAFLRRENVADPNTSLRNQLGDAGDTLGEINGTGFKNTVGTIREAFPNEFPNLKSGKSLDLVRSGIEANNAMMLAQDSPSSIIGNTTIAFDLREPLRTQVLMGTINEAIAVQQLNALRRDELNSTYAAEDLFFGTKFESWTPAALDIEMAQLKNVGASLAYLAASAIISASATEAIGVLTGGDFNPSRMGSNISQRIFGEDITSDESAAINRNLTGVI